MALINLTGIEPIQYDLLADDVLPQEGQAVLVPVERFKADQDQLSAAGAIGVLITTDVSFDVLESIAEDISFAVIEFPAFTDGRGFSLAVRLRKDFGFNGELRATGPVIPDQAQFLARAGFDTIDVEDARETAFQAAASRFASFYQSDFVGGRSVAYARHQKTESTASNEGQRKAS